MSETKLKRPESAAGHVTRHIENLILEGSLRPGEMLPAERQLAQSLSVSRPTLRDALRTLVERGLLSKDAKGVRVAKLGAYSIIDPLIAMLAERDDVADHYLEFRDIVESSAAALAAERANEPDMARIRQCVERIESAHATQNVDEEDEADAELHIAIFEASHNLVLLQIMRSLTNNLRAEISLNRQRLFSIPYIRDLLRDQHLDIARAILDRRPDAARLAVHEHIGYLRKATREIREAEVRLNISLRRQVRGGLGN